MKTAEDQHFDELLDYVHRQRGIDFASYKSTTLRRRIGKRMHALGLSGYGDYLDRLQASPDEFVPLLESLFINVTGFFRDPGAWEMLRDQVIPDILDKSGDRPIRIWCAGVASGEEVYTLVMLFLEHLGREAFLARVKIFATDLDEGALLQARNAAYPAEAVESVPADLRRKYFESMGSQFLFRPDLRRGVIFGRHDLLEDAPISHVHLLVCRNTLMYFSREAQGKVLARFHFALEPEGYLFLGKAEMLLTRRNLFEPVDAEARVFRKMASLSFRDRQSVLSLANVDGDHTGPPGKVHLRDLAFDSSPVPEIVIDASGNLVLANRSARIAFRIGRADISKPFQDIDLSFRPIELRGPIEQVLGEREPLEIRSVEWKEPTGAPMSLDVRVEPLLDDGDVVAVKVRFIDVTRYNDLEIELRRSKRELEVAYEELQSTNEELETTNEELQSTVEELETTNEELQSTNEELETINEELQSTNVEIEALNEELGRRTGELDQAGRYVYTILNSLQSAFLVMDNDLRVRVWNQGATELWGLTADDVEGSSFLSLEIGLPVGELRETLRSCLTGEHEEMQIRLDGHDRRGKPVRHDVRCSPLRDTEGKDVRGVIAIIEAQPGAES